MANAAAGAGQVASPQAGGGGGGQNPFQIATNLYAEKNLQGVLTSTQIAAAQQPNGGSVNAGQYLRGVRLMVRTATAGTHTGVGTGAAAPFLASGVPTAGDFPFNIFAQCDLTNVDGSEILYNMTGVAHYFAQKYFRPWLADPALLYDFQTGTNENTPSFTLFLQPEIRFTAGVLANTDTRSQYRFDYTLAATGNGGTAGAEPFLSVTPYMDAWAQPDAQDLQGTANQPVPPGVNLQMKRRHQIFTLNGSGSDNVLLSTLTGNALRGMLLVVRSSANVRVDGFSDPFYWQLDNRSLGKLNPDIIRQWASDFYGTLNRSGVEAVGGTGASDALSGAGLYAGNGSGDIGVYAFPRWIEPGELVGQGWLYTANSTKLQFESATLAAAANGTAELVTDEVYPVGAVDPSLVDI